MLKIRKYFLTKKKEKEYQKYIYNHKMNMLKAFNEFLDGDSPLFKEFIINEDNLRKLWGRVLDHDISKYDEEEFDAYRKNFFPIDEIERTNNLPAFEKAWKHHYTVNDHHWESRQNYPENLLDIDTKMACVENVLDWLAMGYQYGNRPYEYYEKNKDKINLPKIQKDYIERLIYEGIDKGRK